MPRICSVLSFLLVCTFICVGVEAATLENDAYRVEQNSAGSFTITHKSSGISETFGSTFTVLYRSSSPGLSTSSGIQIYVEKYGNPYNFSYYPPVWNSDPNFFNAPGTFTTATATGFGLNSGKINWSFPTFTNFDISAELSLASGQAEPKVKFTLVPKSTGYFSVGYTGAPEKILDDCDWVWQPLMWQGKRFPSKTYFTQEFRSPIGGPLIGYSGKTIGVIAEPFQIPFRLPTKDNSVYGLLIRNQAGNAQPMVFAPVYGGTNSYMTASSSFNFELYLVVRPGGWYENYKYIGQNICGFGDYRENAYCSLNETLDNLVDFIMNSTGYNYSYWYPEQKAHGYQNDRPGWVRQETAVSTLSLAMVKDDEQIFYGRALPTIEYMTSRSSTLVKIDGTEPYMDGPTSTLEEWSALCLMSENRCKAFEKIADDFAEGLLSVVDPNVTYSRIDSLKNAKNYLRKFVAAYRYTGDARYLQLAIKTADDYILWRIDAEPVDFSDVFTGFWIEVAPIWDVLEQLYRDTNDPKYLLATIEGMKQRTAFNYMTPVIPDINVFVDGINAPAWRVSTVGMNTEASATSTQHRGISNTEYAAPMIRMTKYTQDTFLSDIAHSAVVGRFANYPGYAYRTVHRLEFGLPDYPLRWYEDYVNTAHFNHPIPLACFTIDFLVSEAFNHSDGLITFPSRYSSSSGYFRDNVYGDRPGNFYSQSNVWLWMPRALVSTDNIQINYLSGYGNGKLYLAFTNTSNQPVTFTATVNPALVNYGSSHNATLWQQNTPAGSITMVNGQLSLTIDPKGIVAVAIDNIDVQTSFQKKYKDDIPYTLGDNTYQENSNASFGKVTSMIISMAKPLTSAYVWLAADIYTLTQATLHYSTGGDWQQITDASYPYEFTVPLDQTTEKFICYVEGTKLDLSTENSTTMTLDVFAEILWDANNIDFGMASIHDQSGITKKVLVYNDTQSTLNFTSTPQITGQDTGDFILQSPSLNPLSPGDCLWIDITFKPTVAGQKSAQLQIYTDYPSRPTTIINLTGQGASGIIYVAADGNDNNSGNSWADPLATIPAAIAKTAELPYQIWAKAGTYDITNTIFISDSLQMYGGFDGTETALSQRNNINTTNQSIINMAVTQNRIFQLSSAANVTIDGFTVSGASDVTNGGEAFYLSGCDDSVLIQNCVITNNASTSITSGPIYITGSISSGPVFDHCIISNNSSELKAGAILAKGSFVLDRCTLTANTVKNCTSELYGGGAIYIADGAVNATIKNSVFAGNLVDGSVTGRGGGGAIHAYLWGFIDIKNCVFSGNLVTGTVQTRGGAIYIRASLNNVNIENCTIDDNYTGNDAGGINVRSGNVTLANTIITNNADKAFYVWYDGTATEYANLYYNNGTDGTPVADPLYAPAVTGTWASVGSFSADATTGLGTTILTANGNPFAGMDIAGLIINPDITQRRQTLILSNTDNTVTVEGDMAGDYGATAADSFKIVDYHTQSTVGRFNPVTYVWQTDTANSPAIDTGDTNYDWKAELWPHGKHVNKGAYGNTSQTSLSTSTDGNIADINRDDNVNLTDLDLLSDKWLSDLIDIPENLNRTGSVNFTDFAVLLQNWLWIENL